MAQGSPVTCPSCKLKYFSRANGTCPRCDTPESAAAPTDLPSPAPPELPRDARPVTPLIWIGVSIAVLLGAAAVWSRRDQGAAPDAGSPRTVDCYRLSKIFDRRGAALEAIADASQKRTRAMNLLLTWSDMAKELDGTANDLDAASFADPTLRAAASEHAVILRRAAEELRATIVAARSRDEAHTKKMNDKLSQTLRDEVGYWSRVKSLCEPP